MLNYGLVHLEISVVDLFIYLRGSRRERREIFHPLAHSPKWLQQGKLGHTDAGNQELLRGLLCGWQGLNSLSPHPDTSPCSLAGNWIRTGAARTANPQRCKGWLNPLHQNIDSCLELVNLILRGMYFKNTKQWGLNHRKRKSLGAHWLTVKEVQ